MKKKIISLLIVVVVMCVSIPVFAATRISASSKASNHFSHIVSPTGTYTQFSQKNSGRLLDDNLNTVYSYTHWNSSSSDDLPEISYSFNYNAISDLWIRNGNMSSYSSYYANARIKEVEVSISTLNGTFNYTYRMDDYYDVTSINDNWYAGYQRLAFPYTIHDVFRIDIWIRHCYPSTSGNYNLSISDLLFTSTIAMTPTTPPNSVPGVVHVTLNQRLATRSGPSTKYDELGSYFSAGTELRAISRAWDTVNGIWWIQVEFAYGGTARRAYTGLKRLNMNADQVPEESPVTTNARVKKSCRVYWGPGTSYAPHNDYIQAGVDGTIYCFENEYAQFEYFSNKQYHRVWIPVANLQY